MSKRLIVINIAAALTLALVGIAATTLYETVSHGIFASTDGNNNSAISLGNPFFVEKGKVIGQRVLSVTPQPQLEFTINANGTINNTINFTNTGTSVSNLQKNGTFTGQRTRFHNDRRRRSSDLDQSSCRSANQRGEYYIAWSWILEHTFNRRSCIYE